jgi:hypothetical protein
MSGCKRVWARRRGFFAGLLLALAMGTPAAWGVEPFSVEAAELHAGDLPQAISAGVESHGTRIFTYVNGLRMPICEIFWAKTATTHSNKNVSGRATYSNLEPGSLLGVIRFLAEASDEYREDFHDQKLKAGYYTMRYAVMAGEDARDFLVLLSPASADADPGLVLTDQLIRQGKLASRTDRPAVLSLVTTEVGGKDLPSVRMDENGTCILQDKLHAASNAASAGEVMLAVVLVNPISEEDGS